MPKKSKGPSPASFQRAIATIPQRALFSITMDADSTNEVYDDIDTDIDAGEAWYIYGGWYWFEGASPTAPMGVLTTDSFNSILQVQRNTDSELLLAANNSNVIGFDQILILYNAAAAGTIQTRLDFPRPLLQGFPTISFSETLRVLFRTQADCTSISDADKRLNGYLLYDVIEAPDVGQSKLGQLSNL